MTGLPISELRVLPFACRWTSAVTFAFALLLPTEAEGQAGETLLFPVSYAESYQEQSALGEAWTRLRFDQDIPVRFSDTLSFPAQTSFAQIDLTPTIGMVFVQPPPRNTAPPGISVLWTGEGHFEELGRLQIPESDLVEARFAVPIPPPGHGSPADPNLRVKLRIEASGRIEYKFEGLWLATLQTGGESLAIGAQRLAGGAGLVFADADGDGDFEKYLPPDFSLGLGGRFWTVAFDFNENLVILRSTNQAPVDVGWPAPDLVGAIWGTDSTFVFSDGRRKASLLVFCHERCFACRGISFDLQSLFADFHDDPSVHLLSIVTSDDEARGNREVVSPGWAQVVSPEAWVDFAVTPTPTVFVVGPDGVIRFRQAGGTPGLGVELAREIRKWKR